MGLDGLGACCLVGIVHLFKKLWQYDIVGIQDEHQVVNLELGQIVDGILERFGLGAVLEVGGEQGDGKLGQLEVGYLVLVVGNDGHVKQALGIGLSQNGSDRCEDGLVAFVGGDNDDKAVLPFGLGHDAVPAEEGCEGMDRHIDDGERYHDK